MAPVFVTRVKMKKWMVMIYDTTFPLEERQWNQDSLVGKQ